jgi:hypothetical protein
VASVVTDKSKAEEFAKAQGYELGTMEPAEFGHRLRQKFKEAVNAISLDPDSSDG